MLFSISSGVETKVPEQKQDVFVIDKIVKNSNDKLVFITKFKPRKLFEIKQSEFGECKLFKGDVIVYSGDFKGLPNPRSLLGFNYSEYLKALNVDSLIYLPKSPRVFFHPLSVFNYSTQIRRFLINGILKDSNLQMPSKALLIALLTGEKSFLERSSKELFREAGIVHVLAISGMHVGIVYGILVLLLRIFQFNKKLRFFVICFLLIGYAFITGLQPSVFRAVLMFVIMQVGITFSLEGNSINYVLIAMIIMLFWNSNLLFDLGFQLSFAAVFGILICLKWLKRICLKGKWNLLLDLVKVNLGAFLFTFPLLSFHFGIINFSSLWMSLIIVPLITILLYQGIVFILFKWFLFTQGYLIDKVVGFIYYVINWVLDFNIPKVVYQFNVFEVCFFFCVLAALINQSIKWFGIAVLVLGITLFRKDDVQLEALLFADNGMEIKINNNVYFLSENDKLEVGDNDLIIHFSEKVFSEVGKSEVYRNPLIYNRFLFISKGEEVKDSIPVNKYLKMSLVNYIKNR